MAKAGQVRRALERDGWVQVRQSGSHRIYRKGAQSRVFSFHDGVDLGRSALARVARQFGYTLDELRRMI